MTRSYAVIDHQLPEHLSGEECVVSRYPTADEALAAGRTLAHAKVAASKGTALEFTGVSEDEDEAGTWFFGDTGEDGDPWELVYVDELGRPRITS